MLNSADLYVTLMMLACPTSFALTMSVKKSVNLTAIVGPLKSAKESSVFLDVGRTQIVL